MSNRYHISGFCLKGMLLLTTLLIMAGESSGGPSAPQAGLPGAANGPGWIYLVNHGWHTGLILQTTDYSLAQWPESLDFRGFPFIEVGWGDHDFYQAEDPSWWQTVKAALVDTPSVLFVYGHDRAPREAYATREIFMLPLDAPARAKLVQHIRGTYFRDDRKHIVEVGQYAGGRGRFYKANPPYKLPETCNVWLARGLQRAGFAVDPRRAMRAKPLMRQVRRLPEVKRISSDPN